MLRGLNTSRAVRPCASFPPGRHVRSNSDRVARSRIFNLMVSEAYPQQAPAMLPYRSADLSPADLPDQRHPRDAARRQVVLRSTMPIRSSRNFSSRNRAHRALRRRGRPRRRPGPARKPRNLPEEPETAARGFPDAVRPKWACVTGTPEVPRNRRGQSSHPRASRSRCRAYTGRAGRGQCQSARAGSTITPTPEGSRWSHAARSRHCPQPRRADRPASASSPRDHDADRPEAAGVHRDRRLDHHPKKAVED